MARAWADAKRMRTAGLPVLPHQEQALAKAGADLDRLRPNGAQDLRVALTVRPELAADTDRITATLNRLVASVKPGRGPSRRGTAARLVTAMEREKEQRQNPWCGPSARWRAGRRWRRPTKAGTGKSAHERGEMKALARELKRDPRPKRC